MTGGASVKIKRKRMRQVSYTEQYVHKINERMTWRRMAANLSMIPLNSECDPPGETCSRPIRSQKEQEWGVGANPDIWPIFIPNYLSEGIRREARSTYFGRQDYND